MSINFPVLVINANLKKSGTTSLLPRFNNAGRDEVKTTYLTWIPVVVKHTCTLPRRWLVPAYYDGISGTDMKWRGTVNHLFEW